MFNRLFSHKSSLGGASSTHAPSKKTPEYGSKDDGGIPLAVWQQLFTQTQWHQWIAIATMIGISLVIFWLSLPVMSVMLSSLVLFFLLRPGHAWLVKRGLSNTLAAILILFIGALLLSLFFVVYVPSLVVSLGEVIRRIPQIWAETISFIASSLELLRPFFMSIGIDESLLIENITSHVQEEYTAILTQTSQAILSQGQRLLRDMLGHFTSWTGTALTFLFVPVIVFYLLKDKGVSAIGFDAQLLPPFTRSWVLTVIADITRILYAFVVGQFSVCAILAALYSIALLFIGHPSALAVGLLTGMLSIIPVAGTLGSFAVALLTGALGSIDIWQFFAIIAIYIVLNVIENGILVPAMMSNRVRLHPIWIIITILVGGSTFGLFGVILAIPIAASMRVFLSHLIAVYSPLPPKPEEPPHLASEKPLNITPHTYST